MNKSTILDLLGEIRSEIDANLVDRPIVPDPPDPPDPNDPVPEIDITAGTIEPIGGQFKPVLWKPVADGGRPPVVLFPDAFPVAGEGESPHIVRVELRTPDHVLIETASYSGRTNETRPTYRFQTRAEDLAGTYVEDAIQVCVVSDQDFELHYQVPTLETDREDSMDGFLWRRKAAPGPIDPQPGPTPTLGHVVFSEGRVASTYGLNCTIAARPSKVTFKGQAKIGYYHSLYEPEAGAGAAQPQLNQNLQRWIDTPFATKQGYMRSFVQACVDAGCEWSGVDWEHGFLRDFGMSLLEYHSEIARAAGQKVLHWPKARFTHFSQSWESMVAWCREYTDGLGLWDPSMTLSAYLAEHDRLREAGYRGAIVFLAYAGKGVSDAEDQKIVTHPLGGIFNPGHTAAQPLVQYARNQW